MINFEREIRILKHRILQNKIIWKDISEIRIDPEIEGIFTQKENEIQNISVNMAEHGFDPAHPIILACSKDHPELNGINADGHTRYKAAKRAGLTQVAIIYKEFADRSELLHFVYEQQLLRRNLSENEIFNAWIALNHLKDKNGKKAKSDTEIAEELKISRRQVSKMKEVEKKATPEELENIKSGNLTLNKAYTQIKLEENKKKESKEPFVNPDNESEKDLIQKTTKNNNAKYLNAYFEGWMYVLESLKCGKSTEELQTELAELKAGTKSVESLQESLLALKESYEQKQAE